MTSVAGIYSPASKPAAAIAYEPDSPARRKDPGLPVHSQALNPTIIMAHSDLHRLRSAHATVAKLVVDDLVYLPIFERLDAELRAEEARTSGDAVAYARAALLAQNARL